MSYLTEIFYDSAASLSFDTTLVEVASGAVRLKDLGGATYTTTNPLVTSQYQVLISSLTSFTNTATLPVNTAIQYQLALNGAPYYWNSTTGKWSASDGSFAQSNSQSQIFNNRAALFSDLNLLVPQYLSVRVFLSTTDPTVRPSLNQNNIGHTFTNSNATAISQCLVTGYLADLVGNNPIPTSAKPVQLSVTAPYGFFHGNHFVEPFTKNFSFDNTGYLSASLIETTTPGVKLNFALTVYDGNSILSVPLFSAIVPNQPQVSLNNLSSPVPYSFG